MTEPFYLTTKTILEGIIAFQGIFFSIFIWVHPKGRRQSNRILAIFLLTMAAHFSYLLAFEYFQNIRLPISFIALALYGPLLFFYVSSYLHNDWTLVRRDFLHALIPLYAIIWFFLIRRIDPNRPVLTDWIHVPVYGSLTAYLIVIIAAIRRSGRLVDSKHTEWLTFIIRTFVVAFILYVAFLIAEIMGLSFYARTIRIFSFVVIAVLINGLVYKSLQYPAFVLRGSLKFDDDIVPKYLYSSLTNEDEEKGFVKLTEVMRTEKPFCREDLSLPQLAAMLSIDPRHLSQIINKRFDINYREFLNQFRIREAVALLNDPQNPDRSIKEIMYAVGFSSRSSFNTAFKEITGQTPTDHRNQKKNLSKTL